MNGLQEGGGTQKRGRDSGEYAHDKHWVQDEVREGLHQDDHEEGADARQVRVEVDAHGQRG